MFLSFLWRMHCLKTRELFCDMTVCLFSCLHADTLLVLLNELFDQIEKGFCFLLSHCRLEQLIDLDSLTCIVSQDCLVLVLFLCLIYVFTSSFAGEGKVALDLAKKVRVLCWVSYSCPVIPVLLFLLFPLLLLIHEQH